MSATSVQFTVAAHVMAALAFFHGKEIHSAALAESVNADPTFVRKSLSKLSKAGLITTTRGKNGASTLARSPKRITLLDIDRASAAPPTFAIHTYSVHKRCPVSSNIKGCISSILKKAQGSFENTLDGITLADVVGGIHQATRRVFVVNICILSSHIRQRAIQQAGVVRGARRSVHNIRSVEYERT